MKAKVLKIEIIQENAAFEGENCGLETARILRRLADRIEAGDDRARAIFDINGNDSGTMRTIMRRV